METLAGAGTGGRLLAILLIAGCLTSARTSSSQCEFVTRSESLGVSPNVEENLREIQVRHNLKGDVIVRDAMDSMITVELTTSAVETSLLSRVALKEIVYETRAGMGILLQVEYNEKNTSLATIVGGVVATVIFLAVICLIIWIYHKRTVPGERLTTPTRGCQSSPGGRSLTSPSRLARESDSPCISRQSSVSSRLPAVPPPAAAGGPILKTDSKTKPDQTSSLTKCSPSRQRGVGSPRGVGYKGTLVTFTIVTAVTLAYATCGRDVEVRLVINVPTNNFLDAVKVFFKEEHHNYLDTSNWLRRNHSNIKIYDLKEVLLLNQYGSPCLPRDLCPGANEQRLAGCDSAVGSCVCERGYRLEDGLCIDVDECKLHPNVCPFPATCHNQKGRFWCNCGPGYFFDRHTCKPCSHDCPMGFYEVQSCTVESDRSCKRCSECEGPFYESRSCSGTHDTDCIHAAHPVSISEEETTIEFLEGMNGLVARL